MELISGTLYFVSDAFFDKIDDPFLMQNYEKTKRPHYFAIKDRKSGLYWMIPCSSKVEKYKRLIEQRRKHKRRTDIFKIVTIQNVEMALILQDMFPVSEKYIDGVYTRRGQIMQLVEPKSFDEVERAANHVIGLIRRGIRFVSSQPDALRIEKILLQELALEVKQPRFNAETEAAMQEARDITSGKIAAKSYASVRELFDELDAEMENESC